MYVYLQLDVENKIHCFPHLPIHEKSYLGQLAFGIEYDYPLLAMHLLFHLSFFFNIINLHHIQSSLYQLAKVVYVHE